MSRILKCDMCGKIMDDYETYGEGEYADPPGMLRISPKQGSVPVRDGDGLCVPKDEKFKIDLCENCLGKVMDLIKSGGPYGT